MVEINKCEDGIWDKFVLFFTEFLVIIKSLESEKKITDHST